MYNILICDDDRDIVNALKIYLARDDFEFFTAENGKEAVRIMGEEEIHLVLMDVMMPVMNGIMALAKIRETSNVPVIMLTAKSEDMDKVLGLNVGADDYVTKPFNPVEVMARVQSQLRRYMKLGGMTAFEEPDENRFVIGGICLNDMEKSVSVDGQEVTLTPKEYEILKLLMKNPGRVYSPSEIYRNVWNDNPYGSENTVSVHVRHLREKIEIDPAEPRFLKVVWGQGYKMERTDE